jgi:hypothetical protein
LLLFFVLVVCLEIKVKDTNVNKEEEFFLKKFMELQQANAAMYKILTDLYQIDSVKEIVDKKMSSDFLEFIRKNLV